MLNAPPHAAWRIAISVRMVIGARRRDSGICALFLSYVERRLADLSLHDAFRRPIWLISSAVRRSGIRSPVRWQPADVRAMRGLPSLTRVEVFVRAAPSRRRRVRAQTLAGGRGPEAFLALGFVEFVPGAGAARLFAVVSSSAGLAITNGEKPVGVISRFRSAGMIRPGPQS